MRTDSTELPWDCFLLGLNPQEETQDSITWKEMQVPRGWRPVGSSLDIWQMCCSCRGGLVVGREGFYTPIISSCTFGGILPGCATLASTRNPFNPWFEREKCRVGREWLGCGSQLVQSPAGAAAEGGSAWGLTLLCGVLTPLAPGFFHHQKQPVPSSPFPVQPHLCGHRSRGGRALLSSLGQLWLLEVQSCPGDTGDSPRRGSIQAVLLQRDTSAGPAVASSS